ncbi:hypothetical protein ACFYTQ_18890 [Nocardia sp. NPDC004068]|uniref:hypothetical protein n=1 Tax=Nocardia sp. NPDC004068 TaxID=3364303 RepID=UPI0036A69609
MTLRERFGLPAAGDAVGYGAPHETADGATVITVTGSGGLFRPGPRPLGIFVVHGEKVSWAPVYDGERIAFVGVLTGLLAAVIGTLAVLRRPPWPDLSGR